MSIRLRRFRGRAVLGMLLIVLPSCASAGSPRDSVLDLHALYGPLTGAFVGFDTRTGTTYRYNPPLCARRLSPASTFKIPNSLIGLETGVIPDEHYVIHWDSIQRPFPAWNRDNDMASAITNSVVWYYQELARRVGADRMQRWIDTMGYGNGDISGGIDHFWLGSSLLISPNEEVTFLNRLRTGNLPFSMRAMEIVRTIIMQESTDRWTLRGKTGFADFDSTKAVGWYVGWVVRKSGAFVFAHCLYTEDLARDEAPLVSQRKAIAISILKRLGVID